MITKRTFTIAGKTIEEIHASLDQIDIRVLNLGAVITSLRVPNKEGRLENILLSFQDPVHYLDNGSYLNGIIGPTSGRIKDGYITIHDQDHQLDQNFLNKHHLHGGKECFAFQFFDLEAHEEKDKIRIHARLSSFESDSLYPGNKEIQITYQIEANKFTIFYKGSSDQDTVLNMTSHLYFNLSGEQTDILNHQLMIDADKAMDLNQEFLPNQIKSVDDLSLNVTSPTYIKDLLTNALRSSHIKGIDHPFILNKRQAFDASLFDPSSGRLMQVKTSYPMLVCYTHNYPEDILLTNQTKNQAHQGICFETQFTPNPLAFQDLQQPLLLKGHLYQEKTEYYFSIKKES